MTWITKQSWLKDRAKEVENKGRFPTLRILLNFFLTISAYLYLKQLTSRGAHVSRLHNTKRQEIMEVLWPRMKNQCKLEINRKNYLQEIGIHIYYDTISCWVSDLWKQNLDPMLFSINLLLVYCESMNLIGYITRRLSADSLQFWIANENRLFWTCEACFTPQCTSHPVFETSELPM